MTGDNDDVYGDLVDDNGDLVDDNGDPIISPPSGLYHAAHSENLQPWKDFIRKIFDLYFDRDLITI